ncbi:hypothetical protein P3H15_39350 [Rhodococcus sp. T2V]|uniref:hypothetical protein n=1 Tax=Rhodococcus sp. T2V TaxID=3034164 RepID=UPI0023E28C9E|nr:hypothetical protein [Rhodococcus sp. T2V]MDF3311058.1 hypothetical protein [Rhodococcus sp. T2V]
MLASILHAVTACAQILLRPCHFPSQVLAGLGRVAQVQAHTREIALYDYMMNNRDQ